MLRRRRPLKSEAIQFSFDSFLDLVTNVVGIIIRLILVSWVGARAYHESMQWVDGNSSAGTQVVAPKITDDPLYERVDRSRRDLDEARERLLAQLKDLDKVETGNQDTKAQLVLLIGRRDELEKEQKALEAKGAQRGTQVKTVSLTAASVRERAKELLEDIKKIESLPIAKKQLKYHAPLSRVVHSEELFFECKAGRVTYIDLPTFMAEYKQSMDEIGVELRTRWRVERATAQAGPYRLRYAVEREKSALDPGDTPLARGFRYGLSEWVVEEMTPEHGETLAHALQEKSEFRQLVDKLDPTLTVVTFWVYPDSFELFRHLRDHLYERGLDVAGRPLPTGAPIAASKNGSASRGQ